MFNVLKGIGIVAGIVASAVITAKLQEVVCDEVGKAVVKNMKKKSDRTQAEDFVAEEPATN